MQAPSLPRVLDIRSFVNARGTEVGGPWCAWACGAAAWGLHAARKRERMRCAVRSCEGNAPRSCAPPSAGVHAAAGPEGHQGGGRLWGCSAATPPAEVRAPCACASACACACMPVECNLHAPSLCVTCSAPP